MRALGLAVMIGLLAWGCGSNNDKEYYTLKLEGNGYTINSPHVSPNIADGTWFGSESVGSTSKIHTFKLTNRTGQTLKFTGEPTVSIQGAGADDFQLLTTVPDELETNTYTEFTIKFVPIDGGQRNAVLAITYKDANEKNKLLSVAIGGYGEAAGEIDITSGTTGTAIADGDNSPSIGEGTDFDAVTLGESKTLFFTITNSGVGSLSLTGVPLVSIMGSNAADFAVTAQPSSSQISSGQSVDFAVEFIPSSATERNAIVTIASSDEDEGTYFFSIRGTGAAAN